MSRKQLVPVNLPSFATAPAFPTAVSGDLYFNSAENIVYAFNGTSWIRLNRANGYVTLSATAPVSPEVGDMWFDTTSSTLLVYYSSAWQPVSTNTNAQVSSGDLTSSWWLGA